VLIRTAAAAAMEDTQPLMISEDEEQVYFIGVGEKLKVRRFVHEQRKFLQLTKKDAAGEFNGLTLDEKQYEKLCFLSNFLIAKLADVDKRGEKVTTKIDLGEEIMVSIDWRYNGIDLRMFWTNSEGDQKATKRGIHYNSDQFNELCAILAKM
jgi:hypothetical protein